MSWVMKFFDSLAEEEDDLLMRLMRSFYGPVMQISLLFPSWKRKNVANTFLYIVIVIVALPSHVVILLMSIFKLTDNFDLASMAFHYSIIFLLLLFLLVVLNAKRSVVAKAHRILTSDLGDYATGRIYDEEHPRKWEKNKTKELMRFLCLPALIMVVVAASCIVPYMKKLKQEKDGNEAHYTNTGVNLNLPVAAWYPFPTHSGIFHGVTVLWQLITASVTGIELLAMELMLFRVSQAIIFELKVLQHGVVNVIKSARKLYLMTYLRQSNGLIIDDPKMQRCITVCLNDCIKHHYRISELVSAYEEAVKWPCAMAYLVGTAAIGLSLITMVDAKETGNYETLAIFLGMTLAEILSMYIISVFGENITTQTDKLRHALYELEWDEMDTQNRKTLLNFQTGISNPIVVKAGGIVPISMDTFSSIINSSYSFFNLVNANS